MPISGLVIRLRSADPCQCKRTIQALSEIEGFEPGLLHQASVSAVLEADDYARHDAALDRLGQAEGVCAIDVVFHDFSDVSDFDRLPRAKRETKR